MIHIPRFLSSSKITAWAIAGAISCAFASQLWAAAGDLYVSDLATNSILVYQPDGSSSVFASGFDQPQGLAFDQAKNLYVADQGTGSIYKITPGGTKTVFLSGLQNPIGLAFTGSDLLVAENDADRVLSISQALQQRIFQVVTAPIGVAARSLANGKRYITNSASVLQVSTDGTSIDLAPGEDSINVSAGPEGNVFFSTGAGEVRQIALDGTISTVISGLTQPTGLAFRPARFSGDTAGVGNLYVADPATGVITEITKTGTATPFASGGSPNFLVFEVNSPAVTPTPTPTPTPSPTIAPITAARLQNISTRAQVLTDDKVLIGGFIVSGGTAPKKVYIRAIGPSLANGIPPIAGPLADPVLELHKPDGSVVTNDNWRDSQEQAIEDTGIPPQDDLESAIIATLDTRDSAVAGSGTYTAIVRGNAGGTGQALVEIYDLDDADADSELANLSTRGFVGTGDGVLIGGFILGEPSEDEQVLVRAIGPSLPPADVADPLADPTLELHNADGIVIASNNDWKDDNESGIEATGLAPTKAKESAILANLIAGNYTAIVRGLDDTTGVALVEVYHLQTPAPGTP